jgi:tRNA-Thr(GGU) m(6)t(6)A37 methyltransferase TsaA
MDSLNFKVVARIKSDFPEKFGIPRQSGILKGLKSVVVFEKEFRNADALRGLEGFSHLWLLWIFSENIRDSWKPTVRPPRLGGNTRLGVFATRSSFRPNPIAMSCVKIEEIRNDKEYGPVIVVSGADLMDGTPIVDIKPYLPYTDCIAGARGGFAANTPESNLTVEIPEALLQKVEADKRESLVELLRQDPRPHYQDDAERVYGLKFGNHEIKFQVKEETLAVIDII